MGYHHSLYAEARSDTQERRTNFNVNAVCADMRFEKHLAKLAAQKAQSDAFRRARAETQK